MLLEWPNLSGNAKKKFSPLKKLGCELSHSSLLGRGGGGVKTRSVKNVTLFFYILTASLKTQWFRKCEVEASYYGHISPMFTPLLVSLPIMSCDIAGTTEERRMSEILRNSFGKPVSGCLECFVVKMCGLPSYLVQRSIVRAEGFFSLLK